MQLTATQQEVYNYCKINEYISSEMMKEYAQRLEAEGNGNTLSFALSKFLTCNCPKCNAGGMFKWHFLGKLTHPACNRSWYVSPGTYIVESLKGIFRTGFEIGGETGFKENKKGESGGIFGFVFGFMLGIAFRAPFTAVMIPIQAVVSLTQKGE